MTQIFMTTKRNPSFDSKTFLTQVGAGKTVIQCRNKNHILFALRDKANAIFYIQEGQVRLTVVSHCGKEASVAILEPASFLGLLNIMKILPFYSLLNHRGLTEKNGGRFKNDGSVHSFSSIFNFSMMINIEQTTVSFSAMFVNLQEMGF